MPVRVAFVGLYIPVMLNDSISLWYFLTFGGIDVTSWGIGQIVGITVWIPPVLEFCQLYSSNYRFLANAVVVQNLLMTSSYR